MKVKQRIEGHDCVKTLKNHSKNDKFSKYDSTEFSLRKPQNHNFFHYFHCISGFQLWKAIFLQNWLEILFLIVWLLIFTLKKRKFRGFQGISCFCPSNSCKSFLPIFARFLLFSVTNLKICPSLTISSLFYTILTKINFCKKSTFFRLKTLLSGILIKIS